MVKKGLSRHVSIVSFLMLDQNTAVAVVAVAHESVRCRMCRDNQSEALKWFVFESPMPESRTVSKGTIKPRMRHECFSQSIPTSLTKLKNARNSCWAKKPNLLPFGIVPLAYPRISWFRHVFQIFWATKHTSWVSKDTAERVLETQRCCNG